MATITLLTIHEAQKQELASTFKIHTEGQDTALVRIGDFITAQALVDPILDSDLLGDGGAKIKSAMMLHIQASDLFPYVFGRDINLGDIFMVTLPNGQLAAPWTLDKCWQSNDGNMFSFTVIWYDHTV